MASPLKMCFYLESGKPCGAEVARQTSHSAKVKSFWKTASVSLVFFQFSLTSLAWAMSSAAYHGKCNWYMHFFLFDSPLPWPKIVSLSEDNNTEGLLWHFLHESSFHSPCRKCSASLTGVLESVPPPLWTQWLTSPVPSSFGACCPLACASHHSAPIF